MALAHSSDLTKKKNAIKNANESLIHDLKAPRNVSIDGYTCSLICYERESAYGRLPGCDVIRDTITTWIPKQRKKGCLISCDPRWASPVPLPTSPTTHRSPLRRSYTPVCVACFSISVYFVPARRAVYTRVRVGTYHTCIVSVNRYFRLKYFAGSLGTCNRAFVALFNTRSPRSKSFPRECQCHDGTWKCFIGKLGRTTAVAHQIARGMWISFVSRDISDLSEHVTNWSRILGYLEI